MGRKVKCATLTPGRYIFVCPCGFDYTVATYPRRTDKACVYCFHCKQETGKYYRIMEEELAFTYNWNSKLNCNCFTTLRLYNPRKFCIGASFRITLKGQYKGRAKLISVHHIKLDQVNEVIARLDTGYSRDDCRKLIRDMYKNRRLNWDTQLLDFCLLQYDKEEREPRLF